MEKCPPLVVSQVSNRGRNFILQVADLMIQRVINGLIILMLNMASSNYADLLSVKVWPPTLASQLGPVWRFGGGGWREGGRVRIRGKERNGRKKEEACRMAEQEGDTMKGEGKIGRKQRGGRNLEGKRSDAGRRLDG